MSFSVSLIKNGSIVQTFGSHTPFFAPKYDYVFDDFSPPRLLEVHRTFTVEGVIYGNESTCLANYNALLAQIENSSSYPDGIQLLQNGTPVVDIQKSTGHDYFKVEGLELHKADQQWRGHLAFTLRVTAVKKFTRVIGATTITYLTMQESWSYDEGGLVTQTLSGEVRTLSGASAQSAAQALGLALPGATFAYVTNGPGGCDVEQLDQGDTRARFTSTVRQSGLPLPSGVGPSFSVSVESTTTNGEKVTTTTVSAQGSGAEAAVAAQKPSGSELERTGGDKFRRTASATFVQRAPARGNTILRSQTFTVTGGDRPIKWTQRAGGRAPLKHKGSFLVVEVKENLEIEIVGIPSTERFQYPPPANGLDEDRSRFEMGVPRLVLQGKDLTADRWSITIKRVYFAKSLSEAFNAATASAFSARASASLVAIDPGKESQAHEVGKD